MVLNHLSWCRNETPPKALRVEKERYFRATGVGSGQTSGAVHIRYIYIHTAWGFGTWLLFFHILGMSSSQLTNLYFSEGLFYHQPVCTLPSGKLTQPWKIIFLVKSTKWSFSIAMLVYQKVCVLVCVCFFWYNSAFSSHRFSTPDGVSARLFGYFGWNRCHCVKMLFIDYSMDWFKGKLQENPIFTGKIFGFLQIFP